MGEEFYNELYNLNKDDTAFFGLLHSAETFWIFRANCSFLCI